MKLVLDRVDTKDMTRCKLSFFCLCIALQVRMNSCIKKDGGKLELQTGAHGS